MGRLLDADTLIAAKNDFFRFSFCPGYWDWIIRENANNRVFSIDKIKQEVSKFDDELKNWANGPAAQIFLPTNNDLSVILANAKVSAWANNQNYSQAALSRFFSSGDYWLISYALANDHTVVTREVPAPNSINSIKIPDVCRGLNVEYMNPFHMLEEDGAKFVLE